MLAGVVNLSESGTVPTSRETDLRRALSRREDEVMGEIRLGGAYLIRANVKSITDYDGIWEAQGAASLMAGRPLLPGCDVADSHHKLITDLGSRDLEQFRSTRGVYCGCKYSEAETRTLELFGDKLGIRPLYYWREGEIVAFSSAMRILEALLGSWLKRDDLGVAEKIAYGNPLASRTRYQGIHVLREAEIVRFSAETTEKIRYWRWDNIRQNPVQGVEAANQAYRIFREAVEIRAGADTEATAFLSGGMDSRAIVATLRDLGVAVRAINFSHKDMLDKVLARGFANHVGLPLTELRLVPDPPGSDPHLNLRLRRAIDGGLLSGHERQTVWSGDGGSVGLGCVYLDEGVVSTMREGDWDETMSRFKEINHFVFPTSLVQREHREELSGLLDASLREELARHSARDPGQNLFLFLMVNDQRRHLHDCFEHLDLHRIESHLPFFDSKLLEFVFGLPLDYRLRHRFYTDWYGAFPASVMEVPYQTYPGHLPCPLPAPEGWKDQWQGASRSRFQEMARRASFGWYGLGLFRPGWDLGPFSRTRLLAASLLQLFGIRDYDYVVEAAREFAFRSVPGRTPD